MSGKRLAFSLSNFRKAIWTLDFYFRCCSITLVQNAVIPVTMPTPYATVLTPKVSMPINLLQFTILFTIFFFIRKYRDTRENLPRFDAISYPRFKPSKDWSIDARRLLGKWTWHRWGGDDDRGGGLFSHSISSISSLGATQYSTTLQCLDLLAKIDATRYYKDEEMMMVIFTTSSQFQIFP